MQKMQPQRSPAVMLSFPTEPEVIDDQTVPIIEPKDEDDEAPTALMANFSPDPLNKFVPRTFEEAFDLTRRHLWMPPMEKEIKRWDARGVITAVPRPKGIKTIKGKWVYDLKVDGAGNLVRRRACGVVKGFTQKFGEHWWESFAAVMRYESIQMLFALIASKGLHMWLIDFVGAYLNSKPQGENYLKIPEGFEGHYNIPGVDRVLIMNLMIYGTMDGANNWFRELNSTFTKPGHRQLCADPCIHIQWTDNEYTITGTYTDDVSGGLSSMKTEMQTKSELGDNYEITDLGRPDKVLGMTLIHHDSGNISIHQKPLIMKTVIAFGMQNANPKYTPLPPNVNLMDSQLNPIPLVDTEFMRDKDYRKALGMLNHIANSTQPDISFTVNTLMCYASDPHPFHWCLVLHCIAYLKTTANLIITYRKDTELKPYGYSDSSYADNPDSWRSTAGFIFKSAGGPVSWKSKTQR